jgi:FAD/FMN-containing dehydrogenase
MRDTDLATEIPERLRAEAVMPQDDGYDEARALYNAMIDKQPACILRCAGTEDVVAAVNHARENGLLLAIRGGGHNGPGLGSCDGGIVIDLSPMKRIDHDAASGTATVEAGCTQGEVDRALQPHGVAVPAGIISTTGIAGLTLGGGHGYLSRKHGLTVDNLVSAEVVLAGGAVVTANEDQHPDLFWALRGGGGNFGVVTRFTFRTVPVSEVFGGPVFFDLADAKAVMQAYRDFLPGAPRELSTFLGLKTVPSADPFPPELQGRKTCILVSCYNGPEAEGRAALRPLLDRLPEPMMDGMMQMPFPDLQAMFDPLLPPGLQWYWKGDFVHELTDDAIDTHVEHTRQAPSELSLMHLYPIDGAVQDVPEDATAWGTRDAQWSMVIAGIDPDPARAAALSDWARAYWRDIHAHNRHGGGYVNFMMDDEGDTRIRAAYGPNYDRLVEVKRRFDPSNLFCVNQNILP